MGTVTNKGDVGARGSLEERDSTRGGAGEAGSRQGILGIQRV